VINTHPDLTTSLIPLGDGVALITKEVDEIDPNTLRKVEAE